MRTTHKSRQTQACGGGAFTILELMVVVSIIGIMAAMALPHLGGFTKANTVAAASQQLLDDVNLARQRAMATRSTVYMVFVPTGFWNLLPLNDPNNLRQNSIVSNLMVHQCAAYALVSLRSVGDQPGRSYPHYLMDWKALPDGAFVAPFKFVTNAFIRVPIYSTNTLSPPPNNVTVSTNAPFNQIAVPFPSVAAAGGSNNVTLPCIGFAPSGQLTTNGDEYIPLDLGSVIYATGPGGGPVQGPATVAETPPGNATNRCNLIHISWLTGRAKIERNQF